MKNTPTVFKRFRTAFAPALMGAMSLLFAATSASGQNLISWYTLNGTTEDGGSAGADGTLNGAADYINNGPGSYNQSLNFSGSPKGYVSAPTGGAFDGLEQITITLWLNVQGETHDKGDRLVSNVSGGKGFDFRFDKSGDPDSYKLMFGANNTSGGSSSTISPENGWVFIAVTYNSTLASGQLSFYVGDEENTVGLLNTTNHGNGAIGSGGDLLIGSTYATTEDRTPPAYFSDVRIYGGVLNPEQLEGIRASVAVIPEPAHFAAIFGGVILAMLYLRRRKS